MGHGFLHDLSDGSRVRGSRRSSKTSTHIYMIPVRAFRSISSCHPSVVTCSPLGQVQRQMQWRSRCPEGGRPQTPRRNPTFLTNLTHPSPADPYPDIPYNKTHLLNTIISHHFQVSISSSKKNHVKKKPEHHPQPPENLHHHHISKQNPHLPSFPPLASPGR